MTGKKYTPEQFILKFWSNVNKDGSIPVHMPHLGKCWEWTACKTSAGYGNITRNQTNIQAHKISWEMLNGEIPQGLEVCHSCDNPACVNPEHLFLGTHFQNMRDRDDKGRKNQKAGIENGVPKLDDDKVRYIRQRYEQDKIKITHLAREMNVGKTTIWNIVHYRKWKHVH